MPGMGGMKEKRQTTGTEDPGDVMVDLGWVAPPVQLNKLNDNLGGNGGQFCYYYV